MYRFKLGRVAQCYMTGSNTQSSAVNGSVCNVFVRFERKGIIP